MEKTQKLQMWNKNLQLKQKFNKKLSLNQKLKLQ